MIQLRPAWLVSLREDAIAPESRPTSRNSSLRSVMGYRAHHVHYSSVRNQLPGVRESGRSSTNSRGSNLMSQPSAADNKPPARPYDPQYGYAVWLLTLAQIRLLKKIFYVICKGFYVCIDYIFNWKMMQVLVYDCRELLPHMDKH